MLGILFLQVLSKPGQKRRQNISEQVDESTERRHFPHTSMMAKESAMTAPSSTRTGTHFEGFSFSNSAFKAMNSRKNEIL